MKIIKPILFLFILLITTLSSYATHIVGGNMNYRYIGNNQYELTLTVFRDCWNGVPPFDSPASIGIFNSNNVLLQDIRTVPRSIVNIPPTLDDSCYKPPVNVCYERAIYVDTVSLPLIAGGYQIVYQRCCRNGTIVNLIAPGAAGATYMATIPTDTLITNVNNSNPVFNAWPQLFLCADKPLVFDHSATDYDGDSLVYELFLPLHGADQNDPMPQPPYNPPYTNITWVAPYNTTNMMGGVAMAINSQTGLLTATPHLQGQFVVGIKCKEYRNGVLISETLRDFQFNVVLCQKFTTAASIVPILYCTNTTPVTVGFANNSTGANAYTWNFGNGTTLSDTSHITAPIYTYNDTGYYDVQLIAYGIKKGCNDTVSKQLHIGIKPQATATFNRAPCQDTVLFSVQATNAVYPVIYKWTLGDGTTSTDSTLQHTYTTATNYTAQVITITANGCKDTLTQQITIPSQTPLVTTDAEMCKYTSTALSITNCTSPVWSPNTAIDNVNSFTPIVNPSQNTTYYINANTISSNGEVCPQRDSVIVIVNDVPTATINFAKGNCSSNIDIVNASTTPNTSIATSIVNWGDGTTTNGTYNHTYAQVGAYTITLYITDNKGCKDTTTRVVNNFDLPKGKKQTIVLCKEQMVQLIAQQAQEYSWFPQNVSNYQIQNPTVYADSTIAYYCTLTNYPTSVDTCATQDTVLIKVSQLNSLVNFNLTASYDTIIIGENTLLSFSANTLGAQSILLNDNSTHAIPSSLEVKPTITTTYYATIKDSLGCVFNFGDSLRIVVLSDKCEEPYVLIPTAFTPNNDGVNDEFIVSGITVGLTTNTNDNNIEDYVVVYNRWGQKVFETNNIKQGWDGKYNGLLQDAGVYAYIVKLTCAGGMRLEQKGNVTLIR
jgi:gliding motility-associated-like protein